MALSPLLLLGWMGSNVYTGLSGSPAFFSPPGLVYFVVFCKWSFDCLLVPLGAICGDTIFHHIPTAYLSFGFLLFLGCFVGALGVAIDIAIWYLKSGKSSSSLTIRALTFFCVTSGSAWLSV